MSEKQPKGLVYRNGRAYIEDKAKDLRIRKNYSLPSETISDIEELAKKLHCSASEAIVEAIKIVNKVIVEEEPKQATRKTKKNTKAEVDAQVAATKEEK